MKAEQCWRALACAGGTLFAFMYLYVIGDLDIDFAATWLVMVADMSPAHWMQARSPFLFEAVAMVEAGWLVWLVSPVNLLITAVMAGLLTLNIHGIFSLSAAPPSCGVTDQAGRYGRFAGMGGVLPALLAGSACCAPSLLLLLGIPGLGVFSAFFPWMVPLSIAMLALSRWWQRRLGAPAFWTGSQA